MNAIVKRFQKRRWKPIRHKIHDLKKGESLYFGAEEYGYIKTTVKRLNDAYMDERAWSMGKQFDYVAVSRLK